MMAQKPVPTPNADTRPFWDACNREELIYQYCRACDRAQFYPRAMCTACHGHDLEWRTSSGRGTVCTFTVNHRPPNVAFQDDVPYAIALVDLDEGFRMMMNVLDCDPDSVHIGMRVAVTFESRGEDGEQKIPQAVPER
jgi:uncharacterized OB-fold protein